jgi:hypothetical protein
VTGNTGKERNEPEGIQGWQAAPGAVGMVDVRSGNAPFWLLSGPFSLSVLDNKLHEFNDLPGVCGRKRLFLNDLNATD